MKIEFWLQKLYLSQLSSRFDVFIKKRDTLWNCRCEVCGDSDKKKNKARGYFMAKDDSIIYHCHNCGYSASLVSYLKLYHTDLYQQIISQAFKEKNTTTKISTEDRLKQFKTTIKFDLSEIKHKVRANYSDKCIEYLQSRGIPKEMSNKFYHVADIQKLAKSLDRQAPKDAKDGILFPYYNADNKVSLVEIRQYDTKRFTKIRLLDNDVSIFGLPDIDEHRQVVVLESPLDATFIKNSVAIGGANNKTAIAYLYGRYKDVVLMLDNDYAYNKEIKHELQYHIKKDRRVVLYDNIFNGYKDVGDFMKDNPNFDIQLYIKNNTYNNLQALLKLGFTK